MSACKFKKQSVVKKDNAGFTLIELMVVMAIISIAYSLVGPNLLQSYENIQARAEVRELNETIKKLSYKAFLTGKEIDIALENNVVRYNFTKNDKQIKLNYRYLRFPAQQLKVSSSGFIDQVSFITLIDNISEEVSLDFVNSL